ncbi:Lrp/AsnC family transcriptional regulator of ectoine degradation [Labrys wisconsinensis]|uniref:Lrp/AsnC family transcriptional regulator of ectoine degradation n=1 Tax=Labrys wisconsinensis TaxID=425677 RepID=A0ABU0JDA2_9HYPH|nr:Lrp/AsnC family transcriptional regulator of ectoine degradation [Labrys wisconsinensis]
MLKLDKIDLKILAALQREGRITKLGLAEKVNLSAAACWERLRRLERAGIIAGYSAGIDAGKLGRFATILVEITLKSHRQGDFQRFEAMVMREPAIVGCDAVGGGIDYMLRIVAPDIDAYQRLIDRLLAEDLGIDRYFTYVVTKTVKAAGFPLELLDGDAV